MANNQFDKYRTLIKQMLVISLLVLLSCKREKSNDDSKSWKFLIDSKDAIPLSMDLAETIPLSREALKSLLPDSSGNYIKKRLLAGHKEAAEMSAVQAIYQHRNDSSKIILIEILDGAGPVASVVISGVKQKLDLDFEELHTDGYSKVYENNGIRAWEHENKLLGNSDLEYIQMGRYHISLKGQKASINELWIFMNGVELGGQQ